MHRWMHAWTYVCIKHWETFLGVIIEGASQRLSADRAFLSLHALFLFVVQIFPIAHSKISRERSSSKFRDENINGRKETIFNFSKIICMQVYSRHAFSLNFCLFHGCQALWLSNPIVWLDAPRLLFGIMRKDLDTQRSVPTPTESRWRRVWKTKENDNRW